MKLKMLAVAGLMVASILGPVATAGAVNYTGLSVVAGTMDHTYSQIEADLRNGSSTDTVSALFIKYSGECIDLASFGSRTGSKVQFDILNVAKMGNAWAWVGYYTLNTTGAGLSLWIHANRALLNAELRFKRDAHR